ncbi:NAD(P)H-dependent oxidoreductase [Candidatus Micrarchaeota archaeon]|nr:NAD(P)H-dependent oxidoreductase [Candidatus Micrarchaeota archaeon]
MSLNIAVIYGSVRSARVGLRAAKYMANKWKDRGHDAEIIDPQQYNLPIIDKKFAEYPKGKAPKNIAEVAKKLNQADGFIIVSAEYNHTIPPALSNLLDHYRTEYSFKPSAIVSYSNGSFGGVRAAVALRTMLPALGMPPIPASFPFPYIEKALDADGTPLDPAYNRRIKKFLDEFEWYVNALKNARANGLPY